ncbi:MAG: DUF4250 domain-containing protein [Succinivibrio sp.]|nr:DUF4250 domain-containing protein [Succinivibrio sp.]
MPLKRFATMDPYVLVSAVNMQLRDEFSSLDELCSAQEISKEELLQRLRKADFVYDEESRQFK